MFDLDGRVGNWKFQRVRSAKATPMLPPLGDNPGFPDSDVRNRMIAEAAAYRKAISTPPSSYPIHAATPPAIPELPTGWKLESENDHTIYDCKVVFEKPYSDRPTKWRLHYRQTASDGRGEVYHLNCQGWHRDFPPIEFESFKQAVEFAKKHDREWPCQTPGVVNVGDLPPVVDGVELPIGWKHESLHQVGVKGKALVQTRHCGYILRYSGDSIALAVYLSSAGWSRDFGGAQFNCLADAVAFVKQHDREIPVAHA